MLRLPAILLAALICACLAVLPAAAAVTSQVVAQAEQTAPKVKPSQLLVQPRDKRGTQYAAPPFLSDPAGWVRAKQQSFYGEMSRTLRAMRGASPWAAGLTLMLLSFAYGVLHAAGPGHGKAVVSAWLLANEQQLRRGVVISFMAAFVQALTAIALVSALLLTVRAAGAAAKSMAIALEGASYGLIALTGVYLVWQAFRSPAPAPAAPDADGHGAEHAHACGHDHDHHHHDHDGHEHGPDCGCGHAHMPGAAELAAPVSIWKALSIAFAVGIRPCTGAILVLLFASAAGLYWAGIASTFAMALGTALTVSAIAVLAVTSRKAALRFAGRDSVWLTRTTFALKLAAGVFITLFGGLLFWATTTNTALALP